MAGSGSSMSCACQSPHGEKEKLRPEQLTGFENAALYATRPDGALSDKSRLSMIVRDSEVIHDQS